MGIIAVIMSAVSQAMLSMLATLFTQKFIKDMVILLLDKLAAKSSNPTFKEIIKDVEDAFKSAPADNVPPKLK